MFGFAAKALMVFVLGLLFLPAQLTDPALKAMGAPVQSGASAPEQDSVAVGDLIQVVSGAKADLSGFCDRQPEVCSSTARIASGVKERASVLAQTALKWIAAEEDTAALTAAPANKTQSGPAAG